MRSCFCWKEASKTFSVPSSLFKAMWQRSLRSLKDCQEVQRSSRTFFIHDNNTNLFTLCFSFRILSLLCYKQLWLVFQLITPSQWWVTKAGPVRAHGIWVSVGGCWHQTVASSAKQLKTVFCGFETSPSFSFDVQANLSTLATLPRLCQTKQIEFSSSLHHLLLSG